MTEWTDENDAEVVADRCDRRFLRGQEDYRCKRELFHGGSHTADGRNKLDDRTVLRFTVSWHHENLECAHELQRFAPVEQRYTGKAGVCAKCGDAL